MSGNGMDAVLIGILAVGTWMGYRRGLIRQLIHLFGFLVAFVVAFRFYDDLAPYLRVWIPFPNLAEETDLSFVVELFELESMFYSAIAFGLLFFSAKFGLNLVARLFDFVASFPVLNLVNRLSGALVGFLTTFFILFIIVNILYVMPSGRIHEQVESSFVARLMVEKTPVLSEKLQELWKKGNDHREDLKSV